MGWECKVRCLERIAQQDKAEENKAGRRRTNEGRANTPKQNTLVTDGRINQLWKMSGGDTVWITECTCASVDVE